MLQRPRQLLAAYDTSQPQHTTPTCTFTNHHSHRKRNQIRNFYRTNSITPSDRSWNTTSRSLVDKWHKLIINRRRSRRSIVRASEKHTHSVSRPLLAGAPANSSSFSTILASSQGNGRCLGESDVDKEDLKPRHDGKTQGNRLDRYPSTISQVDPMEKNKTASDARQSSRSHREHQGEKNQTPEQYLAIKKQEAIESVMASFNKWLDKRFQCISYTIEACDASGGPTGGSSGSNPIGSGNGKSGGSSRRPKRQLDGEDQDDFSAGGDENGQERGGNKRAKKDESERRWACPYYKHDPNACKNRSCHGPGFSTIHRMKEHLYRAHRLPKHGCPRCSQPFNDTGDLTDHLRADEPCQKVEFKQLQGIDEVTEAKLRSRKRTVGDDEQKWRDTYLILFPDASRRSVPSPYHETNDPITLSRNIERYKRVVKQVKKELPPLVQKRVERKFEKMSSDMLYNLNDIVRDALSEVFSGLSEDDRSPSATPVATSRATSPVSLVDSQPSASLQDEPKNTSLDLSLILDDPNGPLNLIYLDPFNPLDCSGFNLGDFDDGMFADKVSDSGYASTSTRRGSH
ncbi:hypothetical protein F5Y15DRAFT_61951 [Xylariaceae sp. FL0016]|nr:hypothetical protein F5Y15DRAFT_61951 [Xylariaceae sp. FL0016]